MKVDYEKPLQADYLPTTLTSKDYPNLIADGETVDTIAVPAVLAAYNWSPKTDRYRKLDEFRECLLHEIPAIPEAAVPSEMEGGFAVGAAARLAALPGRPAMARRARRRAGTRDRFDEFLKQNPAAAKRQSDADKDALFKQFQAWEAAQNAKAQARQRAPAAMATARPVASTIALRIPLEPALQRGAGGIAMIRRDVACDQPDRGGEHGGIIGEAEHRQHVRNEIERQDEIGDRAEQRRLHMARRLLVERAIIGREQILGERQLRHHALELDPEAPAHAFAVFRQPIGRLKTHGVFAAIAGASSRRRDDRCGTHPCQTGDVAAPPQDRERAQATPSWPAIAFMALASSMSSPVTPPASWVASTTSTVL